MEKIGLKFQAFKNQSIWLIFLFLFLTACNSSIMTPQGFDSIQLGTPIKAVEEQFGPPYEIENLNSGFQEYTYIQRTPISPGIVDHVAYILYVCQGKVVSKNIRTEQSSLNLNFQ